MQLMHHALAHNRLHKRLRPIWSHTVTVLLAVPSQSEAARQPAHTHNDCNSNMHTAQPRASVLGCCHAKRFTFGPYHAAASKASPIHCLGSSQQPGLGNPQRPLSSPCCAITNTKSVTLKLLCRHASPPRIKQGPSVTPAGTCRKLTLTTRSSTVCSVQPCLQELQRCYATLAARQDHHSQKEISQLKARMHLPVLMTWHITAAAQTAPPASLALSRQQPPTKASAGAKHT